MNERVDVHVGVVEGEEATHGKFILSSVPEQIWCMHAESGWEQVGVDA